MAEEILNQYAPYIESLTLIPSGGGRFEIIVNDERIFSKKATGRHPEPGEVLRYFKDATGLEPVPSDE